jgi:putative SOS response-associated peptidase YedK
VLRKKSGETIRSCMIITEPNRFVAAEVHDRMPVLLRPEQFDAWLDGSVGKEVLVSAPEVSKRAARACSW